MLFYFSATGNSKYVADKIARNERDRLISIPEAISEKSFVYTLGEYEKVGFVTPTYFYGLPTIIPYFIERLELNNIKGNYFYHVLTCGSKTGEAGESLNKALQKKGCTLSARYGVRMVETYIPMFKIPNEMKVRHFLDEAEEQINIICKAIQNCAYGDQNTVKGLFARGKTNLAYPLYVYGRRTKRFKVNENCIKCGLCERVCPCQAIEVNEYGPVWKQKRCVQCLGCLHRCPVQAIRYKKLSENRGRYHNPYIEMEAREEK